MSHGGARQPIAPERILWDENEALEGEALVELRLDRLRSQLTYCYERSDLYRQKMDAIGLRPEDVKTWNDFRSIPPLLTKADEAESRAVSLKQLGHPFGLTLCASPKDIVVTAASSGTSGVPSFYVMTKNDFKDFLDICARYLWRAGVRPGDGVLHASGLSMWVAHLHHHAPTHIGANSIPVGIEAGSERILLYADLLRPRVLFSTPSMAVHLIEKAPELIGKPVGDLGFEILILGAELGAGLPEVRRRLTEAYGAKVYDLIGPSSPFSYLSCDEEEYQGMHELAPDFSIWADDLVDPATHAPVDVVDGAVGVGLMTDLRREAGPVLKYWYGDILQVFTAPCRCGRPGKRIKILGRADDMLTVKGVNVYPSAVKNLVASFHPRTTGEVRIVLDAPPPLVSPPLKLRVEFGDGVREDERPALAAAISQKCHDALRFRPAVELVPPGSLIRDPKKTAVIEHAYRQN
jgi:phenylacetate-CoA ligase